jgi:protein arginine kinase activator
MKCQHCDKPATFHVTELTGPEPVELHLCPEHARLYLQPGSLPGMAADPLEAGLGDDEQPEFSSPGSSGEALTDDELLAEQLEAEARETEEREAEVPPKKPSGKKAGKTSKSLTGKAAKVGKAAEKLEELDQRTCPHCGITFREFRQKGRLGCPQDYDFFATELEPLLYSIHGRKDHSGKRPRAGARSGQQHSELLRLKREMQVAVEREDYESAARLRDQIRNLEG